MENVLKVSNLSKIYGKKRAVSSVNMTIDKGDIYGFIGRNGAGKTTLIKMVLGLAKSNEGSISLFGGGSLEAARNKIGTIIEAPAFVPHLSAYKNMYLQWMLVGGKDKSIINETLVLVGLADTGRKKAKNFSLGMKQRLAIGMALMGNPEFLVLDEPTNGLDPEGIVEVRRLIQKLNHERGITVLISSHILGELSKLATRYGIINDGCLIEEFTRDELLERCQSSLVINVDDANKAAQVITSELNTSKFTIEDQNTIILSWCVGESGKVNSVLEKNEVVVNSISAQAADLEEYFLNAIGGGNNA